MTAFQGIVSPLLDEVSKAIPGKAWFDALTSLRPGKPLAIRASISSDASGTINIDAYKRSLANYQSRGHQVWLLLEASLCRIHEGSGHRILILVLMLFFILKETQQSINGLIIIL